MLSVFSPVIILGFVFAPCNAQESRFDYTNLELGPYEHIYPPIDPATVPSDCYIEAGGTCPIIVGAMFSFGGSFTSSGVVPAVQLAIDQMNDDPYFLPGYRLHYFMKDSQV